MYWLLDESYRTRPLQMPLSSTQFDGIQQDIATKKLTFKENLAASGYQQCTPYAHFKATTTSHPDMFQQLATEHKAQIQISIPANTGYYRVYMKTVRVYLKMKSQGVANICSPTVGCNVCAQCCQPYIPAGDSCDQCFKMTCPPRPAAPFVPQPDRVSMNVKQLGSSAVRAKDGSIHTFTHAIQEYPFKYKVNQHSTGKDTYCPESFTVQDCGQIRPTPFGMWEVELIQPLSLNFTMVESVLFEWELYYNQDGGGAFSTPMFQGGSSDDVQGDTGVNHSCM